MNIPERYEYDAHDNRTARESGLFAGQPQETATDGELALPTTRTDYKFSSDGKDLLRDDIFTYTYDNLGNLVNKTARDNSLRYVYEYNALNALMKVSLFRPYNTNTPVSETTYQYDWAGRRVAKTVDGVTTRYMWEGLNLTAELDADGNLLASWRHEPGTLDAPLSMTRDGAVFYYHYDEIGSVVFLTNEQGHVVQRYAYDTFGNIILSEGSVNNPYTFQGRQWDTESGLYYFRARYYDPHTGRFTQRDPVLSENYYAFTANNPVNLTDPLGLMTLDQETQWESSTVIFMHTRYVDCWRIVGTFPNSHRVNDCKAFVEGCPSYTEKDKNGNIIFQQWGAFSNGQDDAGCGRMWRKGDCERDCKKKYPHGFTDPNEEAKQGYVDCLYDCLGTYFDPPNCEVGVMNHNAVGTQGGGPDGDTGGDGKSRDDADNQCNVDNPCNDCIKKCSRTGGATGCSVKCATAVCDRNQRRNRCDKEIFEYKQKNCPIASYLCMTPIPLLPPLGTIVNPPKTALCKYAVGKTCKILREPAVNQCMQENWEDRPF